MRLKKRIKALEKTQKQITCDHTFEQPQLRRSRGSGGSSYYITAKCWMCDKEIKRCVSGKPLDEAYDMILKQITEGK